MILWKSQVAENAPNIALDGFAKESSIADVSRKPMNREQVIAAMRKQQGERTAKEYAMALGVSESYLSEIYRGRRDPGEKVLGKLRLSRRIVYEEIFV